MALSQKFAICKIKSQMSIYMLQILHTRSDMKYYCNRQLDCHIPQFQWKIRAWYLYM